MHAIDPQRATHRERSAGPAIPADGFEAVSFSPLLERRIVGAVVLFLISVGFVIWAGIAGNGHVFAWFAFMATGAWLARVSFGLFLSHRHRLPVPQIFLDRQGVLKLGLWNWDQYAWSELSDFVVCEQQDDGITTYHLLAFSRGEDLPKGEWARYRRAKLRLQLPCLRSDRSRDEVMHNSVCDWLNEWRDHVLAGGPWPHPHHLRRVEGRFAITAVSDIEYDRWWQVLAARYPGIRRTGAESP